jgi:hypothetical protein
LNILPHSSTPSEELSFRLESVPASYKNCLAKDIVTIKRDPLCMCRSTIPIVTGPSEIISVLTQGAGGNETVEHGTASTVILIQQCRSKVDAAITERWHIEHWQGA